MVDKAPQLESDTAFRLLLHWSKLMMEHGVGNTVPGKGHCFHSKQVYALEIREGRYSRPFMGQ